MEWPKFTNPFVGIEPRPGVHVPKREELLSSICVTDESRGGFPYPPKAPIFWIKYGYAVFWNEVCAHTVAYNGLRQIGSLVRAPGVYYAFHEYPNTYIVMEYIPGKTAEQCLKEKPDEAGKETIYRSIALAISELHRIPIPESRLRPAAITGGRFRHSLFECDREAPLHYESAQQFEDNANDYLKKVYKREVRILDLAREPMVFCQSDIFPANFIIDANNQVTAIDLADVSILPSSFAKFAVSDYRLGYGIIDISPWVYFPVTEGVDNTNALFALCGRLTQGGVTFFLKLGLKLPGANETQNRIKLSLEHEVIDDRRGLPTLDELEAIEKLDANRFPRKPRRPRIYVS